MFKYFGKLFTFLNKIYKSSQLRPLKLEKPRVIQFPVNDICNSRCQMCNIWQQKMEKQITPEELAEILRDPLFSRVKSVGVNGGEPTLRKDLSELVDTLFRELPKLSNIALITNAINSEQVIKRITEVGRMVREHKGHLDVMVSLDGVEKVHDRVRGRDGNFVNAVKVVDYIKSSDWVDSCRLGCTVVKENVYDLHNLLEFAINKDIYIKYRLGIPHKRLYLEQINKPFSLSDAEKHHFIIFLENLIKNYETSFLQKHFYRSLIGQLSYDKPRTAGCYWQHRGVTLSASGELLYCAVESDELGSAIDQNATKLYFGNREHLRNIVRNKCDGCMHDYVGFPPAKVLIRGYLYKLRKKFEPIFRAYFSQRMQKTTMGIKKRINFEKNRQKYLCGEHNHASQFVDYLISESRNHKKILICGWYGTETLGDKAILGGIISGLKENFGDVDIHLTSLEPYVSKMTLQQMPELNGCHLHTISESIGLANSMDLVVFGGGPIMAINTLVKMIAIFESAFDARVPTLLAGCGVGPLGEPYYNKAIKKLLELSSFRIYRDRKSLLLAESIGINTDSDLIAEDPAFTWLDERRNKCQSKRKGYNLLLGLREWPHHQYAPEMGKQKAEKVKKNWEMETIIALEILLKKFPNLRIIPFPMCTNHIGGDDRWFYRRLFRKHERLQRAVDKSYRCY